MTDRAGRFMYSAFLFYVDKIQFVDAIATTVRFEYTLKKNCIFDIFVQKYQWIFCGGYLC